MVTQGDIVALLILPPANGYRAIKSHADIQGGKCMTIAIAGSALLFAALQSGTASTGAVDLFCRGNGDRFVTSQTKVRQVDGSIKTLTDNRRVPFTSAVRVKVANGSGQALIPDDMLADDDPRGWHAIKKLAVTNESITVTAYKGSTSCGSGSISGGSGTTAPSSRTTRRRPSGSRRP